MDVALEFTNMTAAAVPSGITPAERAELATRFREVHALVQREGAAGRFGFRELDAQRAEHHRVRDFAASVRDRYDDIVVLGIGGSALGATALRTALLRTDWNALPADQRGGRPRLHVWDNVDPTTIASRIAMLDLARALFLVISKSGSTAETMSQYLIVRERTDARGLDASRHFVFVTDPVKGLLRPLAGPERIPVFTVPENVGGRFSILTPVGTLPAELTGMDSTALLAGAAAMIARAASDDLSQNPAGAFALLQWRAHQRAGQGIHVLMPYNDALRDVAPWFMQLWAESLGKVDVDGVNVGPTPLASLGATDQHSQLQLYMEGPVDKTVTFLRDRSAPAALRIPAPPASLAELAWLGGHELGELLDAECRATAAALAKAGRPSMTLSVGKVDAHNLGALLMCLMHATVYAGALYRVNALDQPGVELGKRIARAAITEAPGAGTPQTRWEA